MRQTAVPRPTEKGTHKVGLVNSTRAATVRQTVGLLSSSLLAQPRSTLANFGGAATAAANAGSQAAPAPSSSSRPPGGPACSASPPGKAEQEGAPASSRWYAAWTPAHRRGVLSEDGFYKGAMNDSVIWFQLCDQMIFNFDPPVCLDCEGMMFAQTIGRAPGSHMPLIDEGNPQKGIVVKMFSSKCSISVFIFCDSAVAQLSDKFSQSGSFDYATILRHPSGCARLVSASGNGWGWLGTSFITILCLLGGYILIGAIYKYYFLGIHSVEAIQNLEFWISLPQKIKSMFVPLTRSPRRHNRDTRGPYSPVNH